MLLHFQHISNYLHVWSYTIIYLTFGLVSLVLVIRLQITASNFRIAWHTAYWLAFVIRVRPPFAKELQCRLDNAHHLLWEIWNMISYKVQKNTAPCLCYSKRTTWCVSGTKTTKRWPVIDGYRQPTESAPVSREFLRQRLIFCIRSIKINIGKMWQHLPYPDKLRKRENWKVVGKSHSENM